MCSGREQGRKPKGLQRGGKEQREKDHLARERVPAATSWPDREKRQVAGRQGDPGRLCTHPAAGPRFPPPVTTSLAGQRRGNSRLHLGVLVFFFPSLKLDSQDKGFQGARQGKTCRCLGLEESQAVTRGRAARCRGHSQGSSFGAPECELGALLVLPDSTESLG